MQGYVVAEYNLGVLYDSGQGVPQDYTKAAYWWGKAAAQGSARAEDGLGVLYDSGQGVPQDYAKAAYWYGKAAAQGKAVAETNLGVLYAKGQGVPQDYVEAYKWLILAKSSAKPSGHAYKISNKLMAALSQEMTPSQIAQAQRMAESIFNARLKAKQPQNWTSLEHMSEHN